MKNLIFGIAFAAVAMVVAYMHAGEAASAVMIGMSAAAAIDMEGLSRKFDATQLEMKQLIEAAGGSLQKLGKSNEEITARLMEVEQALASSRRGGGGGDHVYSDSPGSRAVATEEFKGLRNMRQGQVITMQVKNITSSPTSAGALAPPDRSVDPVMMVRRPLTIRNLLTAVQTTSGSIEYPRQTVRTNNAAVVTEGSEKPESDIAFELVTVPVRTIAHWVRQSKQIMDDAPRLQSVIDGELRYGLQLTEEAEILEGDGTGVHIHGIIPQADAYDPSRSQDGDTMIDVIAHAIAQAKVALLPATGIVMNDDDVEFLKVIKNSNGDYILGGPAAGPLTSLWGVPLVGTPAMTQGEFLVGAFRDGAKLHDRMDATVLVSSEDGDNFRKNLVTVLAEERTALEVTRPQAFIYGEFGGITG
jgi:HK97 family phage major capsid protein